MSYTAKPGFDALLSNAVIAGVFGGEPCRSPLSGLKCPSNWLYGNDGCLRSRCRRRMHLDPSTSMLTQQLPQLRPSGPAGSPSVALISVVLCLRLTVMSRQVFLICPVGAPQHRRDHSVLQCCSSLESYK